MLDDLRLIFTIIQKYTVTDNKLLTLTTIEYSNLITGMTNLCTTLQNDSTYLFFDDIGKLKEKILSREPTTVAEICRHCANISKYYSSQDNTLYSLTSYQFNEILCQISDAHHIQYPNLYTGTLLAPQPTSQYPRPPRPPRHPHHPPLSTPGYMRPVRPSLTPPSHSAPIPNTNPSPQKQNTLKDDPLFKLLKQEQESWERIQKEAAEFEPVLSTIVQEMSQITAEAKYYQEQIPTSTTLQEDIKRRYTIGKLDETPTPSQPAMQITAPDVNEKPDAHSALLAVTRTRINDNTNSPSVSAFYLFASMLAGPSGDQLYISITTGHGEISLKFAARKESNCDPINHQQTLTQWIDNIQKTFQLTQTIEKKQTTHPGAGVNIEGCYDYFIRCNLSDLMTTTQKTIQKELSIPTEAEITATYIMTRPGESRQKILVIALSSPVNGARLLGIPGSLSFTSTSSSSTLLNLFKSSKKNQIDQSYCIYFEAETCRQSFKLNDHASEMEVFDHAKRVFPGTVELTIQHKATFTDLADPSLTRSMMPE